MTAKDIFEKKNYFNCENYMEIAKHLEKVEITQFCEVVLNVNVWK